MFKKIYKMAAFIALTLIAACSNEKKVDPSESGKEGSSLHEIKSSFNSREDRVHMKQVEPNLIRFSNAQSSIDIRSRTPFTFLKKGGESLTRYHEHDTATLNWSIRVDDAELNIHWDSDERTTILMNGHLRVPFSGEVDFEKYSVDVSL